MTQHILPEDNYKDRATMRRLGVVVGCFIVATAVMALTISFVMG